MVVPVFMTVPMLISQFDGDVQISTRIWSLYNSSARLENFRMILLRLLEVTSHTQTELFGYAVGISPELIPVDVPAHEQGPEHVTVAEQ